jgi:hypothetical protein
MKKSRRPEVSLRVCRVGGVAGLCREIIVPWAEVPPPVREFVLRLTPAAAPTGADFMEYHLEWGGNRRTVFGLPSHVGEFLERKGPWRPARR